MDDDPGLGIGGQGQEFRDELAGAADGVATAAQVARDDEQGDRVDLGVLDQTLDGGRLQGGVIHGREEDAIRLRGERAEAALERGELALGVIGVVNEADLRDAAERGADAIRLVAQDDQDRRAVWREKTDKAVEESVALKLQQGLGRTHAGGGSGGEDECGKAHGEAALEGSADKTDLEISRQAEVALRRTAIISAATETAISSGVRAPISRPMGA